MIDGSKPNNYCNSYPCYQNAIDIFKNEWSSKFPEDLEVESLGKAELFEDHRITWAQNNGVKFKGKRILELGPLEAAHTWMMEKLGAREILAIEAHERAYLKCLISKEITQMKVARFLLGNFEKYLELNETQFDICVASGVLYHSNNPTELLGNICKSCDKILLWTHYYDETIIGNQSPALFNRFKEDKLIEYKGSLIKLHNFQYLTEATSHSFCGGLNSGSMWLERAGIETILKLNGFKISAQGFDHPHHPNGPSVALIAERDPIIP